MMTGQPATRKRRRVLRKCVTPEPPLSQQLVVQNLETGDLDLDLEDACSRAARQLARDARRGEQSRARRVHAGEAGEKD